MALLRKIHSRNIWWRYNNKPYVEPTEEQKIIQEQLDEARRKRAQQAKLSLSAMLGTIEAMCPGAMERTRDMMTLAKSFK